MRSGETLDRKKLYHRLGAICTFANLAGSVFVFVYVVAIAPISANDYGWAVDVIAFTSFFVVACTFEAWWSIRGWNRALTWLYEDRQPTPAEQEATLRLPLREAAQSFVVWLVACVVFPLYALAGGIDHESVVVVLTIFDGGLVTCAVIYLLFERALRPVFALALLQQPPMPSATIGVRPRLLLTWALGSAVPLGALGSLALADTGDADITTAVLTLSCVGLLVGFLMTAITARSVAGRLEDLRGVIAEVGAGHLDVAVTVDDGGEIGMLQSGVNRMVTGLQERRRLADLFGRHVGTEVARRALEQGSGLVSEQRDATAMFVDLVGSSALAEILAPQQVLETLNVFFDAVASAVSAEGGWVNKFEGDGALCVFGAPSTQPDHAARALRAARTLREQLDALASSHPGMDAGIGLASGIVVAGNVGTEQRYEYTVIGRPVNEASRLTDMAKGRSARVIASATSIERARDEARSWRSLGTVVLRGQSAPCAIYEPAPVRERV